MAVQINKSYLLGDFELEPDNLHLWRNGERVHLTNKPFQVLVYLIEHRERLVSRSELLEKFWNGRNVYEENLTKCVGAVRKALDDRGDDPHFILTHWAEGYRFICPVEEKSINGNGFEIERTRGVRIIVDEDDVEIQTASLPDKSRRSLRKTRLILASVAIAVIFATAAGAWYLLRPKAVITQTFHSIAVLPLKNLTGDAANEYLSDGMTESLIASLSKIEDLRVISRGSAFAYKDQEIDFAEVGGRLGIESVLVGSVQKEGEALRVSVRLVNTVDGHVIWTKEINKPANQIFALQDEIARNVAVKLEPQVPDKIQRQVVQHNTENTEAYRLYLKGRFFWNQQTEEGLNKSIEYFNRAITEDPNYVLAYCGVSDAYNSMGSYYSAPNAVMPKAREFATKALALDDESADAHFSMASVLYWYDWDWPRAEREMKRAIELAPNHGLAHNLYGDYLMSIGRDEEGIAEVKRAIELDPLAHFSSCDLGWQFYHARQYEKAIAQARQNFDTVQNCPFDYLYVGQSLEQTGNYQAAATELDKIQLFAKDWSLGLAEKGYTYAAAGQRTKAEQTLVKLAGLQKSQYVDPYGFAIVHLGLGNKDKTLAWLEKAVEAKSPFLLFLKNEPKFDTFREDPRFQDLVRRMRL